MATIQVKNNYHTTPGQTANWFARNASVPANELLQFSNMLHLTIRNAVTVVRIYLSEACLAVELVYSC